MQREARGEGQLLPDWSLPRAIDAAAWHATLFKQQYILDKPFYARMLSAAAVGVIGLSLPRSSLRGLALGGGTFALGLWLFAPDVLLGHRPLYRCEGTPL